MIAIDKKKVDDLIQIYKKDITAHIKWVQDKLDAALAGTAGAKEQAYINELLLQGEKLVKASLSEISAVKDRFDEIKKITDSKADIIFKNNILNCLGYKKLRSEFYPGYFKKLGVKSCVYCNSQLCITVDDEHGNLVARHQVDHFISKDKYPCLSIALFNLYPVCGSCNNKKGVKNLQFQLYAEEKSIRKGAYGFSIKNKDKVVPKYLSNRNPANIEIVFEEPDVDPENCKLNELFSIQSLYNTQIDIVEELILKRHIYDSSYNQTLIKQFPNLFANDDKIIERLIMGNYYQEDEIHNRPMAKFMQDIARQLELL